MEHSGAHDVRARPIVAGRDAELSVLSAVRGRDPVGAIQPAGPRRDGHREVHAARHGRRGGRNERHPRPPCEPRRPRGRAAVQHAVRPRRPGARWRVGPAAAAAACGAPGRPPAEFAGRQADGASGRRRRAARPRSSPGSRRSAAAGGRRCPLDGRGERCHAPVRGAATSRRAGGLPREHPVRRGSVCGTWRGCGQRVASLRSSRWGPSATKRCLAMLRSGAGVPISARQARQVVTVAAGKSVLRARAAARRRGQVRADGRTTSRPAGLPARPFGGPARHLRPAGAGGARPGCGSRAAHAVPGRACGGHARCRSPRARHRRRHARHGRRTPAIHAPLAPRRRVSAGHRGRSPGASPAPRRHRPRSGGAWPAPGGCRGGSRRTGSTHDRCGGRAGTPAGRTGRRRRALSRRGGPRVAGASTEDRMAPLRGGLSRGVGPSSRGARVAGGPHRGHAAGQRAREPAPRSVGNPLPGGGWTGRQGCARSRALRDARRRRHGYRVRAAAKPCRDDGGRPLGRRGCTGDARSPSRKRPRTPSRRLARSRSWPCSNSCRAAVTRRA